jgi:hypothetical protein
MKKAKANYLLLRRKSIPKGSVTISRRVIRSFWLEMKVLLMKYVLKASVRDRWLNALDLDTKPASQAKDIAKNIAYIIMT